MKSERPDPLNICGESTQLASIGYIPQFDLFVFPTRSKQFAVGAKGDRINSANVAGLQNQLRLLGTCLQAQQRLIPPLR